MPGRLLALALSLFSVLGCTASVSPSPVDVTEETPDMGIHNPFPHFGGRPPGAPAPMAVQSTDPRISDGSSFRFLSPGVQSIARRSFDKPRSMIALAFWDPYANNPGATALLSTRLSNGTTPFQVLGRLIVGNHGGSVAYNFDIPWGQLVAIPAAAESFELTGKLIAPPIISTANGGSNKFLLFNDPPDLVLPPGVTLPNASPDVPTGFVAVTGIIGDGSPYPNHSPPPTRTAIVRFETTDGGGTSFIVPIAYGARRVTILGDPAAAVALRLGSYAANNIPIPINTPTELPTTAEAVQLTVTGAISATTDFHVIWDLEL